MNKIVNKFLSVDFAVPGRISIYCLCLFLPVSIALAESVAAFVIFFYLLNRCQKMASLKGMGFSQRVKKYFGFISSPNKELEFIYFALRVHLLAIIISSFLSLNHGASLAGFFGKVLEGVFIFLAIKEFINKPVHFYKLIWAWVLALLVIGISALCQWFLGQDLLRGFPLSQGRVSATFRHANDFGAYLIIFMPLLLWFNYLIFFDRANKNREFILQQGFRLPSLVKAALAVLSLGLAVVSLGLTFSRSSWLAFIFCGFLFFGFRKKVFLGFLLLSTIFIALFSPLMVKVRDVSLITDNVYVQKVVFNKIMNLEYLLKQDYGIVAQDDFMGGHFKQGKEDIFSSLVKGGYIDVKGKVLDRFWQLADYKQMKLDITKNEEEIRAIYDILDKSTFWESFLNSTVNRLGQGRFIFWEEAFGVIRDYPFWGSGLNTYSIVAPHYKINWGGYAHNSYLQMFAEVGLFGLGTFLWLVFLLVKYVYVLFKSLPQTSPSYWVLRGLTFGFIAFLIQAFFDSTFYSVQLGLVLWVFMGILLAGADSLRLTKIDKR